MNPPDLARTGLCKPGKLCRLTKSSPKEGDYFMAGRKANGDPLLLPVSQFKKPPKDKPIYRPVSYKTES